MTLDALCTTQARSQCEANGSCPVGVCDPTEYAFEDLPLLLTSDIPEAAD